MMDYASLATQISALVGMQPSTLLMWIFIITQFSRAMARRIPSTATGFWGFMRQTFAILGIEVANRITPEATITDIAKEALTTPPIDMKVAAAQEEK